MSFRKLAQTRLVPAAELTMVFGITALCQPWIEVLHRFGITIVIIGLVSFMVLTKIKAPEEPEEAEE